MARTWCIHRDGDDDTKYAVCRIGKFGGAPDVFDCFGCPDQIWPRPGIGYAARVAIHKALDAIEHSVQFVVPWIGRRRDRFGWIERVKTCPGCNNRERFIDRVVRPDLLWHRAHRMMSRITTTALNKALPYKAKDT